MIKKYKKIALGVLCVLWISLSMKAQVFHKQHPSISSSKTQTKGLYLIEIDTDTNQYVYERIDGTLGIDKLNNKDSGFYFWIVENNDNRTFQLYSAKQKGKLISIRSNGTAEMISDHQSKSTELVFRLSQIGSKKTSKNTDIVATGYITTQTLKQYGIKECQCNGLSLGNNRFKIHHAKMSDGNTNIPTQDKIISEPIGLTLHPNPTENLVNFRLIGKTNGKISLSLLDVTGKALMNTTDILNKNGISEGNINITSLNSGYYTIKATLPDGQTLIKKIIKN